MNLIAVTDIFGKTKAFEILLNKTAHHFDGVEIVDPYDGRDFNFQNQFEAYTYFQKNIGIAKYIEMLHSRVPRSKIAEQLFLGFSIGATPELETIRIALTLFLFAVVVAFVFKQKFSMQHLLGFGLITTGAFFVFRATEVPS